MLAVFRNIGSGGLRSFLTSIPVMATLSFSFLLPVSVMAAPTFNDAVADYNSGNYARALGKLEAVRASYPTNPMVHYYLALSQQAVGHLGQAKAEFQWVVSSRDPNLAPMAAKGLAQLTGVRTTGSSGGSGLISGSSSPTASAPGGGEQKVKGKVKKVIEFWATW